MNNLCSHILYNERYAGRYPKDDKYYRAAIILYGSTRQTRTSNRKFKRACEADEYARRWRTRVIRLFGFAKQEKMEETV